METNYVLSYWGVKGSAGQLARFMLNYLRLSYTEVNPQSPEEWFGETKPALHKSGLHFPNLPYLFDGDFKISESMAIPLYLAHKHGRAELFGKGAQDIARHAEIVGIIVDIRAELLKAVFSQDNYKELLLAMTKKGNGVYDKIGYIAKFLGDREFLLGYFTFADILVAYFAYFTDVAMRSIGAENPFYQHANLKALQDSVFALPGIRDHIASDDWTKRPLMPPAMCPFLLAE